MLPTARNSDCQFCRVRFQKSDDTTYPAQLTGSCSWLELLFVERAAPGDGLGEPTEHEDHPHHEPEGPGVQGEPEPAGAGPVRGVLVGVLADLLLLVGSRPCLPRGLDSGDPFCSSQTVAKM